MFLNSEQKNLKRAIEKEDGSYSDMLDDDVTYLIVVKVGSRNYFVCFFPDYHQSAQQLNISIVPLQWIYDSIRDKELKALSDYSLRLFEGIVVSTTGFNNGNRKLSFPHEMSAMLCNRSWNEMEGCLKEICFTITQIT